MDSERPKAQEAPPGPQSAIGPEQFDPAGESLAEALRISFWILKIIMMALVVAYVFAGFFRVPPEQVGLVLRFGKIRGRPGKQVLKPGGHWAWPFPVEQIALVKAGRVETVDMRTFWYAMKDQDTQRMYEGQAEFKANKVAGGEGGYLITGDRNIINTIWRINYRVGDDEGDPLLFYRNVADDVSDERARRLVKLVVEACAVQSIGGFEVYDALIYRVNDLTAMVRRMAQDEFDGMETGLKIVSIERTYGAPPLAVKAAFDHVLTAEVEVGKMRRQAEGYRNKILTQAGGSVGIELGAALEELSDEMFRDALDEVKVAEFEKRLSNEKSKSPVDGEKVAELEKELGEEKSKGAADPAKVAALEVKVRELYQRAGGAVATKRQEALTEKDAVVAEVQGEGEFIALLVNQYEDDVERLNVYLRNYRIDKFKAILMGAEDKYIISVGGSETVELRTNLSPPASLLKQKQVVETQR